MAERGAAIPGRIGGAGIAPIRSASPQTPPRSSADAASTGTYCAFCHGAGHARRRRRAEPAAHPPSVLDDQNGELIGPVVLPAGPRQGMPKFALHAGADCRRRRLHAQLPRGRLRRVPPTSAHDRRRRRAGGRDVLQRDVRVVPFRHGDLRHRDANRRPADAAADVADAGQHGGRGGPPPARPRPPSVTVTLPSGERVDGQLSAWTTSRSRSGRPTARAARSASAPARRRWRFTTRCSTTGSAAQATPTRTSTTSRLTWSR